MNKIILASQSPRRKELLGKTGFPFEVVVSDCDENTDEKRPDKLVMELASLKAHDVYLKRNGNIVLGADTVVAHKGEILGKPKDKEEAFNTSVGRSLLLIIVILLANVSLSSKTK